MSHNVARRVIPCIRGCISHPPSPPSSATYHTPSPPGKCHPAPLLQISCQRNFCTTDRLLFKGSKGGKGMIGKTPKKLDFIKTVESQLEYETDFAKQLESNVSFYEPVDKPTIDHSGKDSLVRQELDSINKDCEELFKDPEFFKLPILMIHCQWTEFAVSFHAPDKLNEMDSLWYCFPQDCGIYGTQNRKSIYAINQIMGKACHMLRARNIDKCRIVMKGFEYTCYSQSLHYLEEHAKTTSFVSITDMSRRLGEESLVYQRPVPAYPRKLTQSQIMQDGKQWAPKTKLHKFRRLNVSHIDSIGFGKKTAVAGLEQKASQYGFIQKKPKKKEIQNKVSEEN